MKLCILCVDGLDPYHCQELGLTMPYESVLHIPRELYHQGQPYTLHIWPSMFTGELVKHPQVRETDNESIRYRLRQWLRRHGIIWHRTGVNPRLVRDEDEGFFNDVEWGWTVYHPIPNKTVFEEYNSFHYDVPGISPGFIVGGDKRYVNSKHRLFLILAKMIPYYNYELAALYTLLIDKKAHFKLDVDFNYRNIFLLAQELSEKTDVMILSDHGTVNGRHTDQAYLGCTRPVEAKDVQNVYRDIIHIME